MNKDLQVEKIGNYLDNKNIAICVTGGIAAIETPKIARMLRRYGADVYAYMTPAAQKIITPIPLEWATENEVVTELSGLAEHIREYDSLLVAPATLNTIGQIANGLADNVVTSLVASAFGRGTPIYLAPTMHESLEANPTYQKNLETLIQYDNINIIKPRVSEGKSKIERVGNIAARLAHDLSEDPIKRKRLLITGGPTPVKIDNVRRLSNKFKGSLSRRIATEAYLRGAEVKLLMGDTGLTLPSYLDVLYHEDYFAYLHNVLNELVENKYDAGVFSAAVADYQPQEVHEGKVPSGGALKEIKLIDTRKIVADVRKNFPELFMVTFKYEEQKTVDELINIAKKQLESGYQLVVANRGEDMATTHQAYFVSKDGVHRVNSSQEIAATLIDVLGKQLLNC